MLDPVPVFTQLKNEIYNFYQQNQAEISQNPEFSHWISLNSCGFETGTEVTLDGKTINTGEIWKCEVSLKNHRQNQEVYLSLKEKGEGSYHDYFTEIENYWISLGGKRDYPNLDKYCPMCGKLLPTGKSYFSKNLDGKKLFYCSFECRKKSQGSNQNNNSQTSKGKEREIKSKIAELNQQKVKIENNINHTTNPEKKRELEQEKKKVENEINNLENQLAKSNQKPVFSSENNFPTGKVVIGISIFLIGASFIFLIHKKKNRKKKL